MEKMLNDFINGLSNVIGVRSAYLVNNRGEILYPHNERLGRYNLNAAGALELVQALGVFELAREELVEAELVFLDGLILVYNNIRLNSPTKFGVQETFLIVLADKNFNKAHLRLSLNVSLSPLVSDKKYKKLDPPVKIRKTSVLSREKLGDKDYALAEKVRGLISQS